MNAAGIPQDVLGFAAGALTTIAFVPQVYRIAKTRSAHDISWLMFGTFSVGVCLWLWYGIRVGALPLIVANAVTLTFAVTILLLKWRYGRDIAATPVAPESGAREPKE